MCFEPAVATSHVGERGVGQSVQRAGIDAIWQARVKHCEEFAINKLNSGVGEVFQAGRMFEAEEATERRLGVRSWWGGEDGRIFGLADGVLMIEGVRADEARGEAERGARRCK